MVVGLGDPEVPVALVHAPLTIAPVPFPREAFQRAKDAATVFNTLIDCVAADDEYLRRTLALAARYDDFTARLLGVFAATQEVREARRAQELVLAINRSDYMLDEPSGRLLQVEVNTIASSFGCLSTLVSQLHAYLMERAGRPAAELARLPPHDARTEIADAIAAAAKEHGTDSDAVLMVVQPGERNAYDQYWVATVLWERHRVRTLRRTLAEVAEGARLGDGGALAVGGARIAVVYFRAGYSPNDYPTEAEWRARELLERSDAALCPSIAYQLAGAKKVQQDLAVPGVVERFLPSAAEADAVRACFAGLWGLDDSEAPEVREVLARAEASPDDFVLKPQREGGGNNLYGEELAAQLRKREGLAAYILMQRIRPPANTAAMLRKGQLEQVETVSEVGVFGTLVRRGERVLLNREAGHLVRTKAITSNEGGVAAGFAVLDSPFLVD
ncbi:hypothetical protein WJX81_003695 [Elliptochloris bilobata]|uniref:Glutathione synthetase n=1 Tax=Elliptochloris bilobata TaxID=381761 RepID=A0AAW1S0B2_9CHLO